MSSYQVYKFKTIDKPLTKAQRDEVSSWSSRTTATSTSATFIYSYSDFSKSPKQVVRDYFDVMVYFSNWGTKRVMFKFPRALVDESEIIKFDISASDAFDVNLEVHRAPTYILLDLEWNSEEGGDGFWLEEEDVDLADFGAIRESILNGDYSALYLYWLRIKDAKAEYDDYDDDDDEFDEEYDDYEFEKRDTSPPVPVQLRSINSALQSFIDFFDIDKDLVKAAQTAAKEVAVHEKAKDYAQLIQALSLQEKNNYLLQLLNGEPRLEVRLKKHLDELSKEQSTAPVQISFEQLKAQQSKERKIRAEKERLVTQIAHRKRMEKLTKAETNTWKSVTFNLDRKTGKSYELAVDMLKELKELAIYRNDLPAFQIKMKKIKTDYSRSFSLKKRFLNAGL